MGQIPFVTEDPVANPLTFPAQGDAALGIIMATNWHLGLDNPANKKFVASFRAKYNRDPATFAALGYLERNQGDRRRGSRRQQQDRGQGCAARCYAQGAIRSMRGKFKFNNNHYPIQDLFMMEVPRTGRRTNMQVKGGSHQGLAGALCTDQCPMKW